MTHRWFREGEIEELDELFEEAKEKLDLKPVQKEWDPIEKQNEQENIIREWLKENKKLHLLRADCCEGYFFNLCRGWLNWPAASKTMIWVGVNMESAKKSEGEDSRK